jgi:hypothetical protein
MVKINEPKVLCSKPMRSNRGCPFCAGIDTTCEMLLAPSSTADQWLGPVEWLTRLADVFGNSSIKTLNLCLRMLRSAAMRHSRGTVRPHVGFLRG